MAQPRWRRRSWRGSTWSGRKSWNPWMLGGAVGGHRWAEDQRQVDLMMTQWPLGMLFG